MSGLGHRDRKVIVWWCLYEWANSAFNTLVVTFVYSTYFTQTFIDDPGRAAREWQGGMLIVYQLSSDIDTEMVRFEFGDAALMLTDGANLEDEYDRDTLRRTDLIQPW